MKAGVTGSCLLRNESSLFPSVPRTERKDAMPALDAIRLFDGGAVWRRLSHLDLLEVWNLGMKGVLSLVMLTLLTALTGGALKTLWDIRLIVDHSAEVVLRQIIVHTLMLLALVEVFKTTVTYFREGRVKVTFIVDTILVVMLTEVISQWFKGGDWQALTVLCGVLLILGVVRVMAVRWSPTLRTGPHDAVHCDL
jgi:uncharacterized membrane protein (DUF373 family)